jgi:hypothetical protein
MTNDDATIPCAVDIGRGLCHGIIPCGIIPLLFRQNNSKSITGLALRLQIPRVLRVSPVQSKPIYLSCILAVVQFNTSDLYDFHLQGINGRLDGLARPRPSLGFHGRW